MYVCRLATRVWRPPCHRRRPPCRHRHAIGARTGAAGRGGLARRREALHGAPGRRRLCSSRPPATCAGSVSAAVGSKAPSPSLLPAYELGYMRMMPLLMHAQHVLQGSHASWRSGLTARAANARTSDCERKIRLHSPMSQHHPSTCDPWAVTWLDSGTRCLLQVRVGADSIRLCSPKSSREPIGWQQLCRESK